MLTVKKKKINDPNITLNLLIVITIETTER